MAMKWEGKGFMESLPRIYAIYTGGFLAFFALVFALHWALPMLFVSLHIHPTGVTRLEMVEHDGDGQTVRANLKALAINDLSHLGSTLDAPPTQRERPAEA